MGALTVQAVRLVRIRWEEIDCRVPHLVKHTEGYAAVVLRRGDVFTILKDAPNAHVCHVNRPGYMDANYEYIRPLVKGEAFTYTV